MHTINELSETIIGLCIKIHKTLGVGLFESVYETVLCYELSKNAPVHKKQVLTYLTLANLEIGLLINFNNDMLKDGITRLYNKNYV